MLWVVAAILVFFWALGLMSPHTLGAYTHLLLAAAAVVVALRLLQGRPYR